MKEIKEIIEIRHLLHTNPGVSGSEEYAHDLIVKFLIQLHPDELCTKVGGYGVVAYWKSSKEEAKTIAFRADIDALPSGHRCGHDGHTAIMLRVAEMISVAERPYNLLLIFQPEEETGKGAKKIVDSGILDRFGVDAIFGLHNLPGYPEGTVVLNDGIFAAASCGVVYRFQGRSTHASTPELGINPGRAIASVIERFDALNHKADDPDRFRQTTLICCRIGEEAFGTSAGNGELMFTLRAYSNHVMADLMKEADAIVVDAARQWNLGLEKQLREPFSATENTPEYVHQLDQILSSCFDVVNIKKPFRWSEDFAEYLKVRPGAFFGIGSGVQQVELHHPNYNFPDAIIDTAANVFLKIFNNVNL